MYLYLVDGLKVTLLITFLAAILGIIIGFLVAMVKVTYQNTGKLRVLNGFSSLYLTVIRGTPMVVQLMIFWFVIFKDFTPAIGNPKVYVAVLAFGINSGAYVAEIARSGILSIDKGQMEAGRSLGLTYIQTMGKIIMPQAIKNVLPALGNEFIVLLKETSVCGFIALTDLTKGGDIIRSDTYDAFMPLIAVALIYLTLVLVFTKILGHFERRLRQSDNR
ncbi:amino acid ABC transporter permease [Feifania hominis]|nr:amino acid ABC transporter permease [Feifania hominis]